jgi:DNA-binding CsgD family transcriptional regulator
VPNYVYSLNGNARRYHIGSPRKTFCYTTIASAVVTSKFAPPHLTLCPRCGAVAGERQRADELAPAHVERDRVLAELLAEGLSVREVAARLGVGKRTVNRWVADARDRAGAVNKVQWVAITARAGAAS